MTVQGPKAEDLQNNSDHLPPPWERFNEWFNNYAILSIFTGYFRLDCICLINFDLELGQTIEVHCVL